MNRAFFDRKMVMIYLLIFGMFFVISIAVNNVMPVISDGSQEPATIVIDAGHGGVDGGAVSCSGIYESSINLEIAKRLDDLMHLLGIQTIMIRDTDRSVHTEGQTIAAKKISDIHNRVKAINGTTNAILVSIHQNFFHDKRYSGAQVFYNGYDRSKILAEYLQSSFRESLNSQNNRQAKRSKGVYLMEHINCPGILIECGFLSNEAEEKKLLDEAYQKSICCVIASTLCCYLNA